LTSETDPLNDSSTWAFNNLSVEKTMNAYQTKTFYYHADASALGGLLQYPVQQTISAAGSVSLAPAGGSNTLRLEAFQIHGAVAIKGAQVSAFGTEHEGSGWRTVVTATIEGLNLFEVVTADRLVAQLSVLHPTNESAPLISLNGTKFENLRLNGELIQPVIDRRLLTGKPSEDGTQATPLGGIPFTDMLWVAEEQFFALNRSGVEKLGRRFAYSNPAEDLVRRGTALCSLVQTVEVKAPVRSYCHIITVPDFGNIFLGELLVNRFSAQLTMLRVEMGCMGRGSVSSGTVSSNGSTMP
jgi:hypothetical protein